MAYCKECGAEIAEGQNYCPECGASLEEDHKNGLNLFIPAGLVSAIISTLFLPPLFGLVALYCGYKVYKNESESWGAAIIGIGIVAMTFGMVVGAVMATV